MYIKIKTFTSMLIVILLMTVYDIGATHIRAGEIIVELVGGLTVKIKIIAYTDKGSRILFGNGVLDFGDGSTPINLDDFINKDNSGRVKLTEATIGTIGNEPVGLANFETTHNYPGTGVYHITYTEQNRNAGIKNMTNSVNTTFHIETKFEITNDPFFGINSSPILSTPPLEEAATGVAYFHNPGAYDIDGDSLSYHMVVPLKNREIEVDNYRLPNDARFYSGLTYNKSNELANGPPTISINPSTGLLTWDAPGEEGEYNVAFIVKEWRKSKLRGWINLGFVRRDMQIIVIDGKNKRPIIEVEDVCVIAGEKIHQSFKVDDPDGHNVRVTPLGEILNGTKNVNICYDSRLSGYNCNTKSSVIPTPSLLFFDWATNCNAIREKPYRVTLKVVDEPPPSVRPRLTAFATMKIRVIGPAPKNLNATVSPGNKALLNWEQYSCINADSIKIYRKVGSYDYTPTDCETGLPDGHQYEKIKGLPLFEKNQAGENTSQITEYLDDNDREGLSPGSKYCYRIIASFDTINGGESIVSNESCIEIESLGPIITKVDVTKTDKSDGNVDLAWIVSPKLDISKVAGPVKYKVYRKSLISGEKTLISETTQLSITDTGIDTIYPWGYVVELYDTNDKLLDKSAEASTVIPLLIGRENTIIIDYTAITPWAIQSKEHPTHKIYRAINSTTNPSEGFTLLKEYNVFDNGLEYEDISSGDNILEKNTNYCYYVETYGSYEQTGIPSPLINKSPIVCGFLNDKDTQCGSIDIQVEDCKSYLDAVSCEINKTVNKVSWTYNAVINCNTDLKKFNIFFSNKKDGNYTFRTSVDAVITTLYDEVVQLGGCYKVAAVDSDGNISSLSEGQCVQQLQECTQYQLPNVFTPNGDGKNDIFKPFTRVEQCPRFVNKLSFGVFDRFGNKVYDYSSGAEKSTIISWDGKSKSGTYLPSGFYYYVNEVTFDVIDPELEKRTFNGWIHLLK